MDTCKKDMHYHKIMTVEPVRIPELRPEVRMANYIPVTEGQVWGPREIGDTEFVLIVSGRFEYREEQSKWRLGIGDVLTIPPGVHHTLLHTGHNDHPRFSCIHHEPLAGRKLMAGNYSIEGGIPRVTSTGLDPVVHERFRRVAITHAGVDRYRKELMSVMVAEIWLRLAAYRYAGSISPRTRRMLDWVRTNAHKQVSRRDLAAAFRLSPEHVNAIFKREIGVSPTALIRRERMSLAQRLLTQDGLSVKETAARLGYDDPCYFSRVFRQVTGIPPSRV